MNARENILSDLAPLRQIIRVPDDLKGLIGVARRLRPVLVALITVTEQAKQSLLWSVVDLLDELIKDAAKILEHYPNASREESLNGYYISHPHYCVFGHVCPIIELETQYTAIAASLFIVQMKLERDRATLLSLSDPAYMVGLSLRLLMFRPDESILPFLFDLPLEPVHPKELFVHFAASLSKHGLKPLVTGNLRSIGYLYRALHWFNHGVWNVKEHRLTGNASTHKAGSHGATEGAAHSSKPITRVMVEGDGTPNIAVTEFLDNDDTSRAKDKDLDFAPPGDTGKRGSLLTVPARSASAASRGDRRGLARNIARYTSHAISMSNQRLPITHATLSGHELGLLLSLVENLDAREWIDVSEAERPSVAAWAACRLFLSRQADAICGIRTRPNTQLTSTDETEPSTRQPPPNITWTPQTGIIWLPVESPRHIAPICTGAPECRTRPVENGFTIVTPRLLTNALQRVSPVRRVLFQRSFEPDFAQLLSTINVSRGTALTAERVGRMLGMFMAQIGMQDRVYEQYFRGMRPNQHNPCVYSTVPVSRLQSFYSEACSRMYQLAGRHEDEKACCELTDCDASKEEAFVGSLHVPTPESVRRAVRSAIDTVRILASDPNTTFADQHNAYTTYLVFFLLATTGLRAVSDLLPAKFDLDRATGVCFVSDKDNSCYEQARLVWLHPTLVKQLDAYALHATRLRQYLALSSSRGIDRLDKQEVVPRLSSHTSPMRDKDTTLLSEGIPLLFLLAKEGSQLIPTFPSEVQSLLGDAWQLRIGALRHFVRSELLLRSVPGEAINALLGHGERGEAPWDRFSSLPPLQWRRILAEVLDEIIAEAGFEILPSPFLKSTART